MDRPDFIEWATSEAGLYLHDKQKPTLASWQPYQIDILRHIFPAGSGVLPYSRIIWSDVKKSGKTELAAGVHIYFALFVDIPGEQYVLANDFEGAQSRVWQSISGSLEKNPHLKDKWSVTGSKITLNGGTIKAIAADYRGEAGSNHSLATVDEPWGNVHDAGEKLTTELVPVHTRPNSTIFFTGYQGFEGQSNFWHDLIDGALEGEPVPELAHIDNGDGKPACYRNGRTFLFWNHQPRMPWHTDAYIEGEKQNYRGRLNEFYRVWNNRRTKSAQAFVTEDQWKKLHDEELRALHKDDKRPVVLGVDAATKSDCAAVVGVTWNADKKRVDVVFVRVWYPEESEPIKLTETVGPEIVDLHEKYNVLAVYFDPYQMAAISEMCTRAKVTMVEFPQTSRRLQSDKNLSDLVWGKNLAHFGDETLGEHMTNAIAKTNERGLRIVKELSKKKVDAAVALSMAALGVQEVGEDSGEMHGTSNPFYGAKRREVKGNESNG